MDVSDSDVRGGHRFNDKRIRQEHRFPRAFVLRTNYPWAFWVCGLCFES